MYYRSMRWVTKTTWIRIVTLFGVYLLVVLPILAMCVATWDGVKEGFSLLWLVAPFVCFLAPMFLFFNASALIYGVAYSLLGFAAHGLGVLVHSRRSS